MTNNRRRWRPLRAVLCSVAAITLAAGTMAVTASTASSSPQGPAASDDKIRPKLLNQLEQTDEVSFWVRFDAKADTAKASSIKNWDKRGTAVARALKQTAAASQAQVKQQLNQAGVKYQAFWATNAIKVSTGDLELAEQLAARPEVESLWPSFKVSVPKPIQGEDVHEVNAVEWGIANINADDVWSQYGVKGEGIVIANIDTGVQYDHPALVNQYRGNNGDGTFDHNYNWFDAQGSCAGAPCDFEAHGTHTMGTMVGDDGAGNQIGVAPGAKWIAANGCCPTDATLIASGQWTLEPTDLNGANPDASMRPNIVNNSWGTLVPSNEPFMEDISQAWEDSGIFGMWSNGNNAPGCQTSGSPGSRIINYSAGAYDINNNIAVFSSRGVGQDGETKPNISAPGVNVRSSVPGSGYASFDGTSMAAPHVAGTIALLWSAAPSLFGDVNATKDLLDGTATDHPDGQCGGTDDDNNVFGEGQLDALALLDAAPTGDTGTAAGTITDAATGDPIDGADVTIVGGEVNRTLTTGADGAYSVPVPAGDYEVTAGAFGYADQTATVTIVADQTTTQDFALETVPTVRIGGAVTDGGGHGWPLYARITIDGVPGVFYTNPINGRFSIPVPSGSTYQVNVAAHYPGYQSVTEEVVVGSSNVTRNVSLDVDSSCTAEGYEFSPITTTYEQDFNTGTVPDGWSVVDHLGNGQVWTFDDPGGRGNRTGGDGTFAVVDSDKYGPSGSQDTSLVSPVFDLSDVSSPIMGFKQDYNNNFSDFADVDVSLDGGATWENLLRQPAADIVGPDDEIVAAPQAAGEESVQFRFHYHNANFAWWWEVDDMFVGNRTCDPVNAGLVVGNVSDANTDAGVTGATVTNEGTGGTATTEATPDDPGRGDGWYWMVSTETGPQSLTASADDYVSDAAEVDIEADWVTQADFVLDAGLVTTSKTSLEATMKMDRTATRTFNVTNEGTAPADVTLSGGGGGFVMLGGNHGDASTLHYTDEVAEAARAADASKSAASSVSRGDEGYAWTAANGAAPKPGRSVTPTLPKMPNDTVTITHSVSQEIVQGNSVSCNSGAGNAENGFLRTFNLEDFDITSDFNVTSVSFGVESATATQPITVKLYTVEGDLVYDNMTLIGSTETTLEAQELSMVTVPVEGSAPAGSTLVVELDSPNLQDIGAFFFPGSNNLGQTAPTYLRSETCGVAEPTPTAEIGFPDMHLVMNVTGEAGSSVPWMSVSPETVTLDPGESAQVTVGLDSNVDQPGAYTGRVNVVTNTPYDVEPVGVTMNVTPPISWGKLTGIVSGTSCGGATGPLEEATVQLDWWSGDITLYTDADGRYAYWLDARGNPYSMIVAKDGYKPKAGSAKIVRGGTLTRNFTLLEAGC